MSRVILMSTFHWLWSEFLNSPHWYLTKTFFKTLLDEKPVHELGRTKLVAKLDDTFWCVKHTPIIAVCVADQRTKKQNWNILYSNWSSTKIVGLLHKPQFWTNELNLYVSKAKVLWVCSSACLSVCPSAADFNDYSSCPSLVWLILLNLRLCTIVCVRVCSLGQVTCEWTHTGSQSFLSACSRLPTLVQQTYRRSTHEHAAKWVWPLHSM